MSQEKKSNMENSNLNAENDGRKKNRWFWADVLYMDALSCSDVEDAIDTVGLHQQRSVAKPRRENEQKSACVIGT